MRPFLSVPLLAAPFVARASSYGQLDYDTNGVNRPHRSAGEVEHDTLAHPKEIIDAIGAIVDLINGHHIRPFDFPHESDYEEYRHEAYTVDTSEGISAIWKRQHDDHSWGAFLYGFTRIFVSR